MSQRIAGVYFNSGKGNNFIACIFEHFSTGNRWVLEELYISDESEGFADSKNFEIWTNEKKITDLVFNFPLTETICEYCTLECPGESLCQDETVKSLNEELQRSLEKDQRFEKEFPKDYERARNKFNEYIHHRGLFPEKSDMLSKSLKKRLRKGFSPFWNRPIDIYIWLNYYDQLHKVFNYSYDSFGHTSLRSMKRFSYQKRHLSNIKIWESNIYVGLIELLRGELISQEDLLGIKYVDEFSVGFRKNIISKLESNLNLFIKNEDIARLTFDPKAIHAFILSLCGLSKSKGETRSLPDWCERQKNSFIIPDYSSLK